jgi:hypothetical protein
MESFAVKCRKRKHGQFLECENSVPITSSSTDTSSLLTIYSPPISSHATVTSLTSDHSAARDALVTSSSVLSKPQKLCARCSRINFEKIFQRKVDSDSGSLVLDLKAYPEQLRASYCPLCQLFGSLSPSDSDEKGYDRTTLCYLRAFSANKAFARLTTSDLRGIGDTTLLGVVRTRITRGNSTSISGLHNGLEETGYLCPLDTSRRSPHFGVRLICPESFDVEFSRHCIAYCQENHGLTCSPCHIEPIEFFCVIDCRTRRIIRAPPNCQYVALSYVWGSEAPTHTVAETSSRLLLDDAPKVINDSIAVTLKLQLQYLWIDRYCINQWDERDKHNQIRQMDLIYANAKVTIIAAAGEGPDYGLPGATDTPRRLQPNLKVGRYHIASTLSSAYRLVKTSKWSSRGWTYQEGLLSKRRLIFTDQQVLWECNSMHCTESKALPLDVMHTTRKERFKAEVPKGAFFYKTPGDNPWEIMDYVATYNKTQLTFPEDKLNAMQGIFRVFAKGAYPLYQLMGVPILPPFAALHQGQTICYAPVPRSPEECFLIGLCWQQNNPGERQPHFPSWSWAGWTGELWSSLMFSCNELIRLNDSRVWIEDDSKRLLSFPDFGSLPNFLSQIRHDHRFIWIEARIFHCSIVNCLKETVHYFVKGNFEVVRIPVGRSTFFYAYLSRDRKLDLSSATESGDSGKTWIGILFGDPSGHTKKAIALIVEDLEGFAERVGIISIEPWFTKSQSKGDRWSRLNDKRFSKWWEQTAKLRGTIRLG